MAKARTRDARRARRKPDRQRSDDEHDGTTHEQLIRGQHDRLPLHHVVHDANRLVVRQAAMDFREIVERFAISYLTVSLAPGILAARRNLIALGDRSDISKQAFEAGPMKSLLTLTAFVDRAMREQLLRPTEPWIAMVHLIALMEAEYVQRRLMGLIETPPPDEIRAAALRGVDIYFRAYAPI